MATYNIEHFADNFSAFHLSHEAFAKDEKVKPLIDALRKANDENCWEIAETILDPKFNPDVLVIEEGCGQSDLDYFNKKWLNEGFEGVIVFKTNTDRDQNLHDAQAGVQSHRKEGRVLQGKGFGHQRHGNLLFARGPAFVLVQTPSGYRFWVGVTHQKSKFDTE